LTTDITPVLTKVKKLLALSTSSNPNESASAAAKAQALLMQHNLTMSQVETQDKASSYGQTFVKTGSRVWRHYLLGVLARNNFCEVVYDTATSQACLIGEQQNQEVVTYLYTYLVSQLEPMALTAYKLSGSSIHAKTWKDSFYIGAVQSIKERLEAQKNEMVAASNACRSLVVVKDAELKAAMYKLFPNIRKSTPKRIRCSNGFHEGREAGKCVALNKSIE
jgi:hypothetical protein